MFEDSSYIKETKDYISKERERVYARLSGLSSLKVYKPKANFILCKIVKGTVTAQDLFEEAIKEGLMIRDCASFNFLDESFFRLCFMKADDDDKLLSIIERILK